MWKLIHEKPTEIKEQRTVFFDTLMRLMADNTKLVILDADLGGASGSLRVKKAYPDRMMECGIMEANMMGVAAGMSMRGFIPFVHTFAPFASRRAADQIFMAGAYSRNTINIYASDPGVCAATNGGTHTTFEDISYMRAIPEVMVFDPADAVQLEWLIEELIDKKGVHYIRTTRKNMMPVYEKGSVFEIGKGNVLRKGDDILLLSMGSVLEDALGAADALDQKGYSTTVVDMFSIKPFDTDLVIQESAGKKLIVTLENHSIIGGLGSCVSEVLAENVCGIPLMRIGVSDQFGQVGSLNDLKKVYGLDAQSVSQRILVYFDM